MLKIKKILFQIENNIDAVIAQETTLGSDLWQILLAQHYADVAMLISKLHTSRQLALFKKLPKELAIKVFRKLPQVLQAELLILLELETAASLLKNMPSDELTDLFDYLSDEDLEKYLRLLQAKQRSQILSLLSFNPRSAGGRMNSDVITLQKDFTVRKSVELLQRLGPTKTFEQRMYVTNKDNVLVGYVTLDRLVVSKPETPLAQITNPNELVVSVDEDQEDVANQMHHYGLLYVPVVDKHNHFLGVITADDVFEIIKEEGSEDAYKMFGLIPTDQGYFATPIWRLVWQRSQWLVPLLVLQSLSSFIMGSYEAMLSQYTIIAVYLTMLIGTGGNAGNQSATIVIRGLTTREISRRNGWRVLQREMMSAFLMALILGSVGFIRVFWSGGGDLLSSIAISLSLMLIVMMSMALGALIPLMLDRFDVDPAHSAAPFLATLMDVLGVLILCFVCSKLLG
jgi:magnesium transporter